MENAILRGKPDAGNSHVRVDAGEVVSAKSRRGSLCYGNAVYRATSLLVRSVSLGLRKAVWMVLVGVAVTSASFAEAIYTWTGEVGDNKFSNPKNWLPEGVPTNGAIAHFGPALYTLAAETVDIGPGGLTIENEWDLTCKVIFSGSGKLVKEGPGKLKVQAVWSYTGGTDILDGTVSANGGSYFVPGPYTIIRAEGKNPALHGNVQTYSDLITVTGLDTTERTITLESNSSILGGLVADGDVTFFNNYATMYGNQIQDVSAHGHTVYFDNNVDYSYPHMLKGTFDASLDFVACKATINVDAEFTDPDASYIIRGGTHSIWNKSKLHCGEVVVDNSANKDALLQLWGDCLGPNTALRVIAGGKVQLGTSQISVTAFTTNGVALPPGSYTKATMPDVLVGDGELLVVQAVRVWVGGGSNTFEDPACWSGGAVPKSGEIARFTSTVTVNAGAGFDLGADGIVIDNSQQVTINTVFTGSGSFTKAGAGTLVLKGESSYTGGTVLTAGTTKPNNSDAFGTGTVEIRRTPGGSVTLYPILGCSMTNAVVVTGSYTSGEKTFCFENNGSILGPISATDDVMFYQGYTYNATGTELSGGLFLHGHTAHFTATTYWVATTLSGEVDASIACDSPNLLFHNRAAMVDSDASYSMIGGSNLVYVTSGTKLKRVTVDKAKLRLMDGPAFPDALSLTLKNGAKVDVVGAFRQKAAELFCDGKKKPYGTYTAVNLPEWVEGAGAVKVLTGGFMVILCGSSGPVIPTPSSKTLFIAGDSTMQTRAATNPFGSWGDALAPYLRQGVTIDNRAWSGESTQSFIVGGKWDDLVTSIKAGDFVLIQFGHNDLDQSRPSFYAAADGLYKENLRKMVKDARAKQATPVFATSISQRTFESGVLVDALGLGTWVAAMKAVAAELAVECVDMNALTREKILSVDEATSLTWYFAFHDGKDFTHPTKTGASQFAPLFVNAARLYGLSIAKLFS